MRYKLPSLNISVSGSPHQIQLALESFFNIFPRTTNEVDVQLQGNAINAAEIRNYLPQWIMDNLYDYDIELKPHIFKGPKGQTAACVKNANSIFSAWTSGENRKIHYLASLANNDMQHLIFQAVLIPVLREIFVNRNIILLHCAGVRCPNGLGLLFVAPSGGGKTTTALSMVRIGSKLLGDDLLAIKTEKDESRVFGIPEPMNLTDKTINFFKEINSFSKSSIPTSGYLKKSIYPQQVYGKNCLIDQCRVHLIYFINITDNGPSVEYLSASKAMNKLILAHAFTKNQIAEAVSVSKICEIVSQVGIYELNTGQDPEKLGQWLTHASSTHSVSSFPNELKR